MVYVKESDSIFPWAPELQHLHLIQLSVISMTYVFQVSFHMYKYQLAIFKADNSWNINNITQMTKDTTENFLNDKHFKM